MLTTKVVARAWLIAALFVCACEVPDRPEYTRDHKKASKIESEDAGVAEPEDEVEQEPQAKTPEAPAQAAPRPLPPATDLVSVREPASVATGAPPEAVAAPSPPASRDTPAAPARGIFLRGSLGLQIALGSLVQLEIRVSALLESGLLHELGRGRVDASGAFELELPIDIDLKLGLAEILDGTGRRLGSRLVVRSDASSALNLGSIDGDSSLLAEVLLAALGCVGEPVTKPSALALASEASALLDVEVSAAIAQARTLGLTPEAAHTALAEASVAAARARRAVFAQAGVQLDADLLARSQLELLAQLARPSSPRLTDDPSLIRSFAHTWQGAGALDSALRTRAQVASTLAAHGSLLRSAEAAGPLAATLFPAQRAGARVEAEVSGSALLELLTATGAGSTALAGARDAGATLRSDVEQAADLAALQTARARFVERVCGRASSSGGLLGGVLGGTVGLVGGLLDGVLGLVTQLSANLEQNLSLDLAALARADSCGGTDNGQGTELSLSKLARTLAGFAEDVRTSAVGSKSGSAKADAEALAKLVATAQLTLRAAR